MEMYYNDLIMKLVNLTAILVLAGSSWFVPHPDSPVFYLWLTGTFLGGPVPALSQSQCRYLQGGMAYELGLWWEQ